MTRQMALFGESSAAVAQPEPKTTVCLGHRSAERPLRKRRREALDKFCILLDELEGKDIWISTCGGSGSHFWMNYLKLERLQVEKYGNPPGVIVLWGRRQASVRVFTDQVVDLREQQYQGYTLWLLDFWNGFGQHPIDSYRPPGYVSLDIVRFKD